MSAAPHTKKPALGATRTGRDNTPTVKKELVMNIIGQTTDTVNAVCARVHCDAARDGVAHERDVDGNITHRIRVAQEVKHLGRDNDLVLWTVDLVASDGPYQWVPAVHSTEGWTNMVALYTPGELRRFAGALRTAADLLARVNP